MQGCLKVRYGSFAADAFSAMVEQYSLCTESGHWVGVAAAQKHQSVTFSSNLAGDIMQSARDWTAEKKMEGPMRGLLRSFAIFVVLLLTGAAAPAEDAYPSRPVHILVP